MAYVEKHGTTWRYRIPCGIDAGTGRRKQVTKGGFRTKKEAQLAASEAELAISGNAYVPNSKTTFDEFAAEWLKIYAQDVKVSSVRIRAHQLGLLSKGFGSTPIQRITARTYEQFLSALVEGEFSVNTISGVHTTARMVFKKALQYKLIKEDPTQYAKPPRRQSRSIRMTDNVPRYLEKDELIRFLDAARVHGISYDYTLFTLIAYTGMRIGEACALLWEDIDFDEGTVTISKTLYSPNGNANSFELLPPKTANGYRIIDVPDAVLDALRDWRKEWLLERMAHASDWYDEHDFVFVAERRPGRPICHRGIQVRIDRIQKTLSPPIKTRITPHVFRHTHISLLAEAGVPLHEIMDRVGQLDDETTKRVYLHVTKTRKKEACRLFDNLMKSAKKA
ncbi:MAG: site-specific integrase [Selenomonadaceae bacterium]|nr:site-specific integrase [Selenomonadaceae bacterium]